MAEPRKPVLVTAGLPPNLAHALEPIKQTLEMITGARNNIKELKGLRDGASITDIIGKINDIVARLNATGRADV